MSATNQRRWPAAACLLVALILTLGFGGTVQAEAASGSHLVVAAAGASGPQAVLGPQAPSWLGGHLSKGPVPVLVIGLLLVWCRRTSAAVGAPRTQGRPPCGSRAPPAHRPT
jgi:hypothetical protein